MRPSRPVRSARSGVAIDSIEDMRELFWRIPLGSVSTSMTINAPAAVLLLLYQLVAEEQGVAPSELSGTIQNDVLKEYIARGTYIFPPGPSLRLVSNTFAYCREQLPRWNTISISGYHMAEAGATPAQEIAFTLSNGIAYVEAALAAGMAVDDFAPRLSFFFVSRTTLLEEVAKFRAARRIWAQLMRDQFGARDEKSMMLRFHSSDRWRTADGSAARGQSGARCGAGFGGGVGRYSVAAHQLLRRGHRSAHAEGGAARTTHPTGARVRD